MRDHYEVLQVSPRADPEVIRAAYRILARKYHPDHGGDAQLMIALNDAWDVLGDPGRRTAYDAVRRASALSVPLPSYGPAPVERSASPAAGSASSGGSGSPHGSADTASAHPGAASWASSDAGSPRAGPPPGNPSGSVLDFGQYAGWSIGEIARFDLNYLEWLQRSPSGRRFREEIDELLRRRRGASPAPHPSGRFGR
jgi:curved DNA-binding protein CbpA